MFSSESTPTKNAFHYWQQPMVLDHSTKKHLMFELDAGHIEQIVETLLHAELLCKDGSVLVLDGVLTFEPAGEIHRHEPTRNVTGQPKGAADRPKNLFANRTRFCIELFEPDAHTAAMVPFLGLDLDYSLSFRRLTQALPMAPIGIRGRNLPRVGILQNTDEIFAGSYQINRIVTENLKKLLRSQMTSCIFVVR